MLGSSLPNCSPSQCEHAMSASRSMPVSTPMPRSKYTRSSVAMLPVAFGANLHELLHQLEHSLRRHRAFKRAAERDADGDRDRHLVCASAPHQRQRGLEALCAGCVLVPAPELVSRGERIVDLVHTRGGRALVALLIQDQTGIDNTSRSVNRGHDL